jgi:dephospho-CoA kinase
MLRVGLTGGIGSGKTEVAGMLGRLGASVIDADEIGARVVEPGSPALDELVTEFGSDVRTCDGRLDRAKVALLVFNDESKLATLNAIVHPHLISAVVSEAEALARADPDGILVLDAALLLDWDILDMFELVVVVTAPPELRLARLVESGMSEEDARARMSHQISDDERLVHADIVLDNSGTLEELEDRVARLWDDLRRAAQREDP